MLKWSFDHGKNKDPAEDIQEEEESSSTGGSSESMPETIKELASFQERKLKICQAYEDYRDEMLSELHVDIEIADKSQSLSLTPIDKNNNQTKSETRITTSTEHTTETNSREFDQLQVQLSKAITGLTDQLDAGKGASDIETRVKQPEKCDAINGRSAEELSSETTPSHDRDVGEMTPADRRRQRNNLKKDDSTGNLSDVLEIIRTLKSQFDSIQSQLEHSAKVQHKMEEEIDDLKIGKAKIEQVLAQSRLNGLSSSSLPSQSSTNTSGRGGSSVSISIPYHRSNYSLPDTSSAERRASNSLVSSFIASLPSPLDMDKPVSDRQYSESEETVSSISQDLSSLTHSDGGVNNLPPQKLATIRNCGPRIISKQTVHSTSLFDLHGAGHSSTKVRFQEFKQAQRLHLVRDLAESERRYCRDLWQLTQYYYKLLYSTGAVPKKDINRVFPANLTTMYEQHCRLLKSLNRKVLQWRRGNDNFGDILSKISSEQKEGLLPVYKDYIEKFPNIIRIVNKLASSSQLFQKVLRKSKQEGGAVGDPRELCILLVGPIQKLPLYIIFTREALQSVTDSQSDSCYLRSSSEIIGRFLRAMSRPINACIQLSGAQATLDNSRTGGSLSSLDSNASNSDRPDHGYSRGMRRQQSLSQVRVNPSDLHYAEYNSQSHKAVSQTDQSHRAVPQTDQSATSKDTDDHCPDLIRRLTHSLPHHANGLHYNHDNEIGAASRSKVRFKTPEAESSAVRGSPSRAILNGKSSIAGTFKGMFLRK